MSSAAERSWRADGLPLETRLTARLLPSVRVGPEESSAGAAPRAADPFLHLVLERAFLHDLGNTAMTISGFAGLLQAAGAGDADDSVRRLVRLARRLSRQIDDQRAFVQAEAGELVVQPGVVGPAAALQAAVEVLDYMPSPAGRNLEIDGGVEAPSLVTDAKILERVLLEMLRNALEATPEGGTARAWVESRPGGCEFRVWNEGVIDPRLVAHVFTRSCGAEAGYTRPLATYAMKLFGEHYLGGTVGFTTAPGAGTCFSLRLPP
jgi:signal transduction histidine kinase